MTMLVFVTATLLVLGGAVVAVLDGPVTAARDRNRRVGATLLVLAGVALAGALIWAVISAAAT